MLYQYYKFHTYNIIMLTKIQYLRVSILRSGSNITQMLNKLVNITQIKITYTRYAQKSLILHWKWKTPNSPKKKIVA